MVKKVVASLVLTGSLAMGLGGVASGAPSPNCANAPTTIARLKAEEAQLASVVTSLQAAAAHGGRVAIWLQRPIAFLTRVEAGLASQVIRLEAQCPAPGGSGGGGVVGIS